MVLLPSRTVIATTCWLLVTTMACGRVVPEDAGVDGATDGGVDAISDGSTDCMPSGSYCADGFIWLVDNCCSHGCTAGIDTDGAPLCN